jgi:hypothetical protein
VLDEERVRPPPQREISFLHRDDAIPSRA